MGVKIAGDAISPDDFCSMLRSLGIEDATPTAESPHNDDAMCRGV